MGSSFQTAQAAPARKLGPASSHAPKAAMHPAPAGKQEAPLKNDRCACGGGCPRCADAAGARFGAPTPAVWPTAESRSTAESRPAAEPEVQDRSGAPSAVEGDGEAADWDIAGGFGSLTGPPQFTVSASTRTGPTYNSCRGFSWVVDWATTGRNGFIVQEITNSGSITRCDGTTMTPPNTPHFWEAWPVDGTGAVGDGGGDLWFRAPRPGTRGSWTLSSNVGFAAALDPAAGFSRTAVPDANGLLATTTDPNNLYPATLTRRKTGVWDCCAGNNYHRES